MRRPFATDDALVDRLQRVHDTLIDIGYRLPSLAREVEEIRKELPGATRTDDRQTTLATSGTMREDGHAV